MIVMALASARAREDECDTLEGHAMYDSSGEVVGWLGQVMEESGYPCEHMGMGDEGYTSCWSSSEISRLKEENARLRELAETLWMAGDYRAFVGRAELAERLHEAGIEVE